MGGRRFEGQAIIEPDWSDADLSEAVFEDCRIEDAQVSGVDLTGARFRNCRFVQVRLARAELREAVFEGCGFADPDSRTGLVVAFSNLEQARFANCDLTLSLFDRSSLYGIEMDDCNLRGARFEKADFAKAFGRKVVRSEARFRNCNLELADLSGAKLAGCSLAECDLRDADLSGADLEGADLSGSNLFHAILIGTRLARADLRCAEVSGLDLAVVATRVGLKITASQQYALLSALGLDVHPDPASGLS
jgi:fluoroquinolone resistance protein